MNAPHHAPAESTGNPKRRKALTIVLGTVLVVGVCWGLYEWLVASHYESTDNAYVQGNVIQITPQIAGTVSAILVDDTEFVKAGQPLVQLDPADARLALDQAQANLGQVVRQVRTLYANNAALSAQINLRSAEAERAASEVTRAQEDLARRQSLSGNGAVSKEEIHHAQLQLANARSALAAAQAAQANAREQLLSNQAMTAGTDVAQHPGVKSAAAKMREAYLATQRAVLRAPVDGYIARRTVQLGQRVAAGAPLMSVIPLAQVWVDANFKEVQLRNIRIGQPVDLTSDAYGKRVHFEGKVVGVSAGTGAAFALLPAQNATGNWIKVVQRVPVRIALNAQQVTAHPLRVGLSMDATVDVSDQSGQALAQAAVSRQDSGLQFISGDEAAAQAAVDQVIAENGGTLSAQTQAHPTTAKKYRPAVKQHSKVISRTQKVSSGHESPRTTVLKVSAAALADCAFQVA
jgi:membrane fusion protein (multidrug efflux system)